jgi:hypothetical protein
MVTMPYFPTVHSTPHPNSSPQNKWEKILSKIWNVVKTVLYGLLGAALFATNPTLFAIGFIAGIIWDKKVQEISEKIINIWKTQTWGVLLLTGIASFLSLQVTWAAGSVLYAANLGSKMAQRAQEFMQREQLAKWSFA